MSSDYSDDDMPLARPNGHRKYPPNSNSENFESRIACAHHFNHGRLTTCHALAISILSSPRKPQNTTYYLLIIGLTDLFLPSVSKATISKSEDKAMDKANAGGKGLVAPVSIRNGPVDTMDIDSPHVNGNSKRKSRTSLNVSYKDDSDSDDAPIVCASSKSPPLHTSFTF
jgi:hypothetical protein